MNCRKRWELAAAVGAAVIVSLVAGREARAEKLWTERPAELRSSPGDDSQVVKRVGKGKSLEVVKRLGTWVMVEYEGRTGWIRRTALSAEPASSGNSDNADSKDKKDSKKRAPAADDDSDGEASPPKAAAAGARRRAARKRAERHRSRNSRRAIAAVQGESRARKAAADEEEPEDEEIQPGRPRSTWGARGLPGGPLKVEIQAISVQAFAEPTGRGKVVFTAQEGDRVRVLARAKDRWLLVENAKKRTGWIPAVTVRDHGLLLDARKDPSLAEDDREAEQPAPSKQAKLAKKGKSDEGEEKTAKPKGTRTAAASDGNGDEFEEEASEDEASADDERSSKSKDEAEASVGTSSADDILAPRKPWTLTGMLRGGFTLVGMDTTPTGGTAEEATYNGPTAGLTADFMYRLNPRIGVVSALEYDYSTALGGLTHSAGGAEITDIALSHHRITANVGASYGKRAVGILRAGYYYEALLIDDLDNPANLPRETTQGPTLGLGFLYDGLFGTHLTARLGLDALVFGSRSQTEGSRDGTDLDSLLALWGTARVDLPVGQHLTVTGGYRFGYTSASWIGVSERNGAAATDETDQSHEVNIGVGWRL